MATYNNNLALTELATGEGAGTWGATTNANLESITESLGRSTLQAFSSDANATVTLANGTSGQSVRALNLIITGAVDLTATRTLTLSPNTISRVQFIKNSTTGSQSIEISQGSGANVTIPNGQTKLVYFSGAGAASVVGDVLDGLSLGAVIVNTSVTFEGSAPANFGGNSGNYLKIYEASDGNGRIEYQGTGTLNIQAPTISLKNSSGTPVLTTDADSVTLRWEGPSSVGPKLQTTELGVDISGEMVAESIKLNSPNGSPSVVVAHPIIDLYNANQAIPGIAAIGIKIGPSNYKADFNANIGPTGVATYAFTQAVTVAVSEGAEEGRYEIWVKEAGVDVNVLQVKATGIDVIGTVEADGFSGTGALTITDFINDDTFASASATNVPTALSIKTYIAAQGALTDTLAEILAIGNTTGGTDIQLTAGDKIVGPPSGTASDYLTLQNGSGAQGVYITSSDGLSKVWASETDVSLYHTGGDNAGRKLQTTNSGIDVTGTVDCDGLKMDDGEYAQFGTANDLQIFHSGTHSYIKDRGTGILSIQSDGDSITFHDSANARDMAKFSVGGTASLNWAGGTGTGTKLATTATGIDVTGKVKCDGVVLSVGDEVATTSGTLNLRGTAGIFLLSSTGSQRVYSTDTAVSLSYGATASTHAVKLATTEAGIDVTGNMTASNGIKVGGSNVMVGVSTDLAATATSTSLATALAIKTYVDTQVGGQDTLAEILAIGNSTGGTNLQISPSDDLLVSDTSKLKFETDGSNYLQIYKQSGTSGTSYIHEVGGGALVIKGESGYLRNDNDESQVTWNADGVTLGYNGSGVLDTTSTGIDVTGTVTADGVSLANDKRITLGSEEGSNYLEIFESTTGNGVIKQVGTGNIAVQGQNGYLQNDAGNALVAWDADHSEISWQGATGAGIKLATTETGIDVTGTVVAEGFSGTGVGANVITHFSTDGNFSSSTNTIVPTALAVKTYVDNAAFPATTNNAADIAYTAFNTFSGKRIINTASSTATTYGLPTPVAADVGKSWVICNPTDSEITIDHDASGTANYIWIMDGVTLAAAASSWTIKKGAIVEIVVVASDSGGGSATAPNYLIFGAGLLEIV